MIELNLYWWYLPIILFVFPFIYTWIRGEGGDYDMGIDVIVILIGCWLSAIFFTIGKLL